MWRWLARLEEGLIAVLLAVMTMVTFVQVIARYVFNYSFVWALELVSILFAWLIFIGMSYGVREGSHIGMDAVVRLLGPRLGRALTILATLLCIAYSCILFYGSWRYITTIYQIGNYAQDLPVPVWIPRLALPIGFGLLTIRFIEVLYRAVRGEETRLVVGDAGPVLRSAPDEPSDPVGRP